MKTKKTDRIRLDPRGPARTGKPGFRALDRLLAVPMRVHRYRNLHTQILEELIHDNDCGRAR